MEHSSNEGNTGTTGPANGQNVTSPKDSIPPRKKKYRVLKDDYFLRKPRSKLKAGILEINKRISPYLNNRYVRAVILILALYFFIVGIKTMSGGFKDMGSGFSEGMIKTASNPLVGLFIGILATSIIQSSSATTSMVVGMVAAEPDFLPLAIPIIIGANIGTSVTNIIVSFGHITRGKEFERAFSGAVVHDFFNVIAASILFPVELITQFFWGGKGLLQRLSTYFAERFVGSVGVGKFTLINDLVKPIETPIREFSKSANAEWLSVVIGIILLFIALKFITSSMRILIEGRLQIIISKYLFKTSYISFGFGVLLTALIQSSSITTSLVVPLVGGGVLTVEQIFPYTLGANIGTTVTALLAAFVEWGSTSQTGSAVAALSIAFAHLLFNTIAICIIYPFKRVPIGMAKKIGAYVINNKKVAIIYIFIAFYIIPGLIILLLS
ncbi:MAG: Na/Pi symporter [Methanomassiliicoccales archaeon]|nr:MAG: Na/Pi symporter [Methanomassiliicoccales archaeon]